MGFSLGVIECPPRLKPFVGRSQFRRAEDRRFHRGKDVSLTVVYGREHVH